MLIEVQFQDGPKETFRVNKNKAVIGRSPKCDVSLSYPGFSREHFQIEERDGSFFVTDLGSTNGVHIDGERIPNQTEVPYQEFLQMSVAETSFNIRSDLETTSSFSSFDSAESTAVYSRPRETLKKPPEASSRARESKPQSGSDSKLIAGLGIAVLLAGGYFLMKRGGEEELPVVQPAKMSKAAENKASTYQFSFKEMSEYYALWDAGGCKQLEETQICDKFKKRWGEKEFFTVTDKEVLFFINLTREFTDKNIYTSFQTLPQVEKEEIVLSYFGTISEARQFEKPIVVIGFAKENEAPELITALAFDQKNMSDLNDSTREAIFSRAFTGETYYFNQVVKPYLAIKSLR